MKKKFSYKINLMDRNSLNKSDFAFPTVPRDFF